MGSIFHLKYEGKPDNVGNPRGCWRYEDKSMAIRDTLNEKFASELKRLREGGVTVPFKVIVDQLLHLKSTDELPVSTTIKEYAESYIEDKLQDYCDKPNRMVKKIKAYERRTRGSLAHFVTMYGDKRLCEVNAKDIKAYYKQRRSVVRKVNDRLQNLQIDSVGRELAVIRAMYNHALRFEKFKGVNPVFQAGIPFEHKKRNRVLSLEEQKRLLSVCDRELRDIIMLLLNTGCRLDEVLNLQWTWVDLDKRLFRLPDFITKNGKARNVKINQVCIALLRERQLITKQSQFVFPSGKSKSGHLEHPKRAWYKALHNANIGDLHIHDLKHTCGSRLKELKVDGAVVQEVLAHSDYRTTQQYIHVNDTVQDAIELLGFTYFGDKSIENSA